VCSRYDKLMQSALSLRPVNEFDGCIGEQIAGLGRQDAAAEGRLVAPALEGLLVGDLADAPVGRLDDKGMLGVGPRLDGQADLDEQPTHDDAGNLTYDGLHQYTYEAWNPLTKVERAYPGDEGPETGSVVATLS